MPPFTMFLACRVFWVLTAAVSSVFWAAGAAVFAVSLIVAWLDLVILTVRACMHACSSSMLSCKL